MPHEILQGIHAIDKEPNKFTEPLRSIWRHSGPFGDGDGTQKWRNPSLTSSRVIQTSLSKTGESCIYSASPVGIILPYDVKYRLSSISTKDIAS
jgi:hypothetical protein